jgi:hypothetical protein
MRAWSLLLIQDRQRTNNWTKSVVSQFEETLPKNPIADVSSLVMRGLSRSKNGVASLKHDARVHADGSGKSRDGKFVEVSPQHGLPGQARQ